MATLLDDTHELLERSALTLPEIAAGAGVGVEWLRKFRHARIPNPGVVSVQRVHDFLRSAAPDEALASETTAD